MGRKIVHDTVTALYEAHATGETAKIFSNIRRTMQIPMLTSIWRILAESEADLASTWGAVKPLYATDQPEAALARLRSDAEFPKLQPVTQNEIENAGVSREALNTIKTILAAYNRSNSLNLLTQTALVVDHSETHVAYPVVATSFETSNLPLLLGREEISDPVWEIVIDINSYGTNSENPGLATIYRHLAYWPGVLSLMQSRLAIAKDQGEIAIGADSVTKVALEEGARLAHLRGEDQLNKMSDYATSTVADYVDGPFNVARIVNIGTALSRWLDEAA